MFFFLPSFDVKKNKIIFRKVVPVLFFFYERVCEDPAVSERPPIYDVSF